MVLAQWVCIFIYIDMYHPYIIKNKIITHGSCIQMQYEFIRQWKQTNESIRQTNETNKWMNL